MIARRNLIAAAGAVGLVAALPHPTLAQSIFPNRPIRIIIPYPPGGSTDIIGRRVGQRMSEAFGQPVVVENRAGGNTSIGADAVAKAPADGHTLLFTSDGTFVLNPVLFPTLPYNIHKDFVAVAPVAYVPLALVVNPSTPANDMKELVAYIKGRKDLAYASMGTGSQPHLLGEMFKKLTGVDLVHVPYKGAAPAVSDLLGGQVLMTFGAFPTVQGHIASGRLKVLALSGEKRLPFVPTVPTFTEAGFKDMDIGAWYGFLAPAGTPRDVVIKLNAAINTILGDRDFVEKSMASQGMLPMNSTPEEMSAMIRSEIDRMTAIVKKSGAKAE